jgi:hypothetical protein
MRQSDIWHGLEREVRAKGSRLAFDQARARHAALRAYPDLASAVNAAMRSLRDDERDAIVVALLAEYRETRGGPWSAAAILAMTPLLLSLVRRARRSPCERSDAKSNVLAAFLQAANQIATADRIALRLYSETRRRVLRPRRVNIEDFGRRSTVNVDHLWRAGDDMDSLLDAARLVLLARALVPARGETLAAYAERLLPSRCPRERRRRREALKNQRAATLADLRSAFQSITDTQPTRRK